MSEGQSEANAELIQFLSEQEVRCPQCSRWLRGAGSDCCPECGGRLHLGLIWSNSFDGWWASSLFGTSFAALLSLCLLARWLCSDGMRFAVEFADYQAMVSEYGWNPPPMIALVVATFCAAGTGASAAYILTSRRFFACSAPRTRWIAVTIAISSPVFVTLTMYMVYRLGFFVHT